MCVRLLGLLALIPALLLGTQSPAGTPEIDEGNDAEVESTTSPLLTLESVEWTLDYLILEYQTVTDSQECPAPEGAYDITRRQETVMVDNGDGSFSQTTIETCDYSLDTFAPATVVLPQWISQSGTSAPVEYPPINETVFPRCVDVDTDASEAGDLCIDVERLQLFADFSDSSGALSRCIFSDATVWDSIAETGYSNFREVEAVATCEPVE